MIKRSAVIFLFLMYVPVYLFSDPIYFPTEEKSSGLLQLKSDLFSLGAEFETKFLIPQGDEDLEFNNGNQGIFHSNESRNRFTLDKITLIPKLNLNDTFKFYAELEASMNQERSERTFFREGHATVVIPNNFFIKVGLDDRFISPEFVADNGQEGDNKRLTSAYPVNGIAFWKDEDLGLTMGGDHPIGEKTIFYWRGSYTNGLSLGYNEITQNPIYPLFQDDRDITAINFVSSENKEKGAGMGFKHSFSDQVNFNVLGFYFHSQLAARDLDFLSDVIRTYTDRSPRKTRIGGDVDLNIFNFNLFTQYMRAKDGLVTRDGLYIQPALSYYFRQKFLEQLTFLYRFNFLDVRTGGFGDNISTSPFTWDRITHTIACNIFLHPYILLRNEFHLNEEITGVSHAQLKNNEFMSQLEVRF